MIVMFDDEATKQMTTKSMKLTAGRRLISKRGLVGLEALEDYLAGIDDPEAWISFTTTIEEPLAIGYLTQLTERYPNIVAPRFTVTETTSTDEERVPIASLTLEEQFHRFVAERYDETPHDDVVAFFNRITRD